MNDFEYYLPDQMSLFMIANEISHDAVVLEESVQPSDTPGNWFTLGAGKHC